MDEERYRALCFWLYAQPPVLHERLNTRVDTMLEVYFSALTRLL